MSVFIHDAPAVVQDVQLLGDDLDEDKVLLVRERLVPVSLFRFSISFGSVTRTALPEMATEPVAVPWFA